MDITCPKCIEGTVDGSVCVYCDGDGKLDLTDSKFKELGEADFRAITGVVWDKIIEELADIKDKCNDIFEKVNE